MRNDILNFIKRELIGPDPLRPHIQENGEEILTNEPPRLRYSAGVLFPRAATFEKADSTSIDEVVILEKSEVEAKNNDDPVKTEESKAPVDVSEDFEEEIGLANSFLPSAMGFSCFLKIPEKGFKVKVNAAIYELQEYSYSKEDGTIVARKAYYRIPLDQEFDLTVNEIPLQSGKFTDKFLVNKEGNEINLRLNIRNRTHKQNSGNDIHLLTFTLINQNIGGTENIRNEDCFFQVSFSVNSEENCFCPYKVGVSNTDKEDEKSNLLLFRNKKTFGVGHGCSPWWNDNDIDFTNSIITRAIPDYEIKPIVPNELKNVELKMLDLSDLSDKDISVNLIKLNLEYEAWIDDQEIIAQKEFKDSPQFTITASRHIKSCRSCLRRMKEGVELLNTNKKINRAFKLMNRAMLLQQLHYSIETRNWLLDKGNIIGLKEAIMPDINDITTWKQGLGSWRPFQLAFILMNLNSMLDAKHPDREMVDLIWFPTGGGKTEAYLGLSAFTIFLKRLKDKNDSGTTVLMRYTLRLLTAQQFQRAAALICACDKIRKESEEELGDLRITIGLWVGELTPNSREEARKIYQKMEQGREEENPFVVLKCPWCGSQMGYIKDANSNKVKGYKRRKIGLHDTIIYQCDNIYCDFSKHDFSLPLLVIDDDIYDFPPTLLIGTVDKFAMLTWKPHARALFGFRENERLTPPELIIQDELHLISGPLGSMVGLYETMIEELCTANNVKPKIIASSATISRAKEQINSLYGRGTNNVNIFPAQCLNAGDSFFAYEDKASTGRTYVGIFASALPSHATAQVRVLSALLQSIKSIPTTDERKRDPYWTALTYFNSIRELGHAATLIRADIREYMNSIWIRKSIKGEERRFINKDIELTSRINSNDIPEYLEQLSKSWTGDKSEYPVDVCLATNMISVGVDIQRLGLMVVIGQPKTTSEYIQATSRVGRSKKGPGLVFTIYNCSKPRDRSHFEHFQDYHSKIYSKVEPTSVTPFSAPARERALHAILIGLIRFYSTDHSREKPKPYPAQEVIERVTQLIYNRVNLIDEKESEKTLELIKEKLEYWKNELPMVYGKPFGQITDTPLMYASGTNPSEDIKVRAWSTPTSMRNVDATCEAYVIPAEYLNIDN
jgi:Helicase conserved C-terminal domain